MGFFADLFRFQELGYAKTQESLLRIAKFTPDTSKGYFKQHCEFTLLLRHRPTTTTTTTKSAGVFSMPSVAELRT